MSDFNEHSLLWGYSDLNDKGKIIEDCITENDLCIFNGKQPIYLHPAFGTFSSIDLFLCHPSLYLDFQWSVCDVLLFSCLNLIKVLNWPPYDSHLKEKQIIKRNIFQKDNC